MKKLVKFFLITIILLLIIPVGKFVLFDIAYAFLSLFAIGSGILLVALVIGIPVLIVLIIYKLCQILTR